MFKNFFLNPLDHLYYVYPSHYDLSMVSASVLLAIFASCCSLEMLERLARNAPRQFWLPVGTLILGSGIWAMHFLGMLAFRLECGVTYDPWVTALSMVPGIVAAAVALNSIAAEETAIGKRAAAGVVMALGIGLMHFIGMAAIRLDGILRYEPTFFLLSLLAALLLSVAALLSKPLLSKLPVGRQPHVSSLVGGIFLGVAISSTHYIAMEAAHFIHEHPGGNETVIVAASPSLLAIGVAVIAMLLILSALLFTYLGGKIASIRKHMDAILAVTSQGFMMMDERNSIVKCNPAMAALLGTSPEQVVGRPCRQFVESADETNLLESYRFETRLLRIDGTVLPCLVHGNPVFGERGEWLYAFALFSDITEQKRHERQILEKEQSLLDILNVSPIAVRIAADRGSNVMFYNQAYAELIGKMEIVGDDPRRYYARREDYDEVLAELEQGRQVRNRQIELKIKEEASHWVLASYMPIHYRDKEAVLGWFFDITERIETQAALSRQLVAQRQVEDTLRLANLQQQVIFDSASCGILLMRDCVILRCNRKLEEIFGYRPSELDGQPTRLLYASQEAYEAADSLAHELLAGKLERREWELMKKDGTLFWTRISGQTLQGEHFNQGQVLIIEDITLEREAVQQMLKAKEIAEEAARVKSDFLANMSHEIRTPMNAIIGLSHLIMKTELTGKQVEYMRKIRTSSQHLLGIINDILDFSKIEAGKLVMENIEFDLEHVLGNLSALINEKANDKKLELIFDVTPDVPVQLVGDPLRLGQVLINFCTNAVKFTGRGEVSVVVRKEEETENDVLLKLSVKDTGIGLAPDQIDKLFQSFQQADSSTTRKYGGTGLGLAISKNLAKAMGGTIGVRSELGKGSEFWFTARLGKGNPHQRRTLLPQPDLRGKRTLVVDDNEYARVVVSDLLHSLSFNVEEAASGAEAIKAVKRAALDDKAFDAIFIDWQMPSMDGIETARTLKGLGLEPQPKMLLVTAYGREEVLQNALKTGFDEVLIKPVTASTLFDSVARLFGADAECDAAETGEAVVNTADLGDIAGARVLVVEDNEMNQQIARELLEDAGFEVDLAVDGQEAVDKVHLHGYDIVLMDMQMPVMDGVEATRRIRKDPQFSGLPIVAMTANAMRNDRELCLAAGMNDHLAKPIEPDDLWGALRRWIKPRPSSAKQKSAASMPSDSKALELPEDIEGLDIALGLRRVLGKRGLFQSMLKKFATGQADALERIQTALDRDDRAAAERLAHTLKGLAGNIGAMPLQALAERLEAALRDGLDQDKVAFLLAATSEQLDPLVVALQARLLSVEVVASEPVVDRAGVAKAASRLAALLEDDDADSVACLGEHAGLLSSAFPDSFPALEQAVTNYEFERGLAILKQAVAASLPGKEQDDEPDF